MKNLDVKTLDKIVKQTIAAVEKSKLQIFEIYDAARNEMENVRKDVERIKQEAADLIVVVDELERKERRSRLRLMEVHRNFRTYTEEDMQKAYQEAENTRVELEVAREREANLRRQRDELEIRLRNLRSTVDKAEELVSQVGVALGFLGNQMGGVLGQIESLQQRQMFGAKIIRAQEEERRRVAREIHDGPAQAMANIVFRAEVCERLLDSDTGRAKAELKDLREQVRLVLRETRKLIFGLRPMTLDDLGLVPTIRRVLETMKERTGIYPELRILGEEKRFDTHLEIGLFRIVQEALNNVEKHAQANTVWVRIDFRPQVITAVIEDDGIGFKVADSYEGDSFGLMGMRERIELLGGEISIKSEVNKGTKIYIKMPLK